METQKYLSGELTHRLAAIDVGTNSIRLVVAEALRDGNYRILDEERVSTRLGRGLHSTGRLNDEAMAETLAVLRRFKQIAEGFQPFELRTIATCAVREAENGQQFCRVALEELGLEIEVISAEKEAHLAFYSVQRSFDLSDKNIVMADIGGGSTEIVLASGSLIDSIYATNLGAVRMSEIYGSGQAMIGDDFHRMTVGIDRRLRRKIPKLPFLPYLLIGSGGTFTSLASMMMAQKNQTGLPMRGYHVTRAELAHLLERLRKMSPKARRNTPGLSPDRADIIVAGLTIVDRVMRCFKVNTLQVHTRGVRDGLLLAMIERFQGRGAAVSVDREFAVDRFAAACGSEAAHGRHVARLAGEMFEQLAGPAQLDLGDRILLETAARLQDVGYLIDYDRHHKHSYHLILNSRLQGFQPHELELIANIARYHRGSKPKKKHANFMQLSPTNRRRVEQLAAILRLAGGLDRSHSQQVTGVTFHLANGDAKLQVHSPEFPDVDLWGTRRRAALFESVFNASLSIDWVNCPAATPRALEIAGPSKSSTLRGESAGSDSNENLQLSDGEIRSPNPENGDSAGSADEA